MEEKKERLKALLDEYTKGNACLAFSGGIDSSLILKLAQEAADRNGTKLYAVTLTRCSIRRQTGRSHPGWPGKITPSTRSFPWMS